jgi:hypothetical protein
MVKILLQQFHDIRPIRDFIFLVFFKPNPSLEASLPLIDSLSISILHHQNQDQTHFMQL